MTEVFQGIDESTELGQFNVCLSRNCPITKSETVQELGWSKQKIERRIKQLQEVGKVELLTQKEREDISEPILYKQFSALDSKIVEEVNR